MVAELLWQLTGSRTLRNASSQIGIAAAMFDTLLLWQERARQRRVLAGLDDHLLFDIGRSREEVARECAKPVWRA